VEKLSEYRLQRRVQFYETDAAGIVHFSCYFRYMEEAEHAFWRAAGLSIAPLESEYGWPRVAVSCDYRSPLRFEDEFEVWIRIVAMSSKSIRYACVMALGDVVVARLTMTTVCVSKDPAGSFRAVSLPPVMHERFQVSPDVIA
jgi:YbgC/YbaW family acyl-CoA thioester hydrolase